MGWGDFFGAIGKLIPGRVESMKNELSIIEKKKQEIIDGEQTVDATRRLNTLLDRERVLRERIKNAS